jgi:hypothetical protein
MSPPTNASGLSPGQMLDFMNMMNQGNNQNLPPQQQMAAPQQRYVQMGGETVREVIKEVPVEVIKYVDREVIKEVPVEVIKYVDREVLKEIPVTQIVEKEVIREVPVERIIEKEVLKEVPVVKYVTVDGRDVEEGPNGALQLKHPMYEAMMLQQYGMHPGMMPPHMMAPHLMPPWAMPPPPVAPPAPHHHGMNGGNCCGACSCCFREKQIQVVEKEVIKEVKVDVIKEVPKEVVKYIEVEVPVEVIREVIKHVEVPVEVIVEKKVEVEVTKNVEVPVQIIREVPVEVIKERECCPPQCPPQPPMGCHYVDVPVAQYPPQMMHYAQPEVHHEVVRDVVHEVPRDVEYQVPVEYMQSRVDRAGWDTRDYEREIAERKEGRRRDMMLDRAAQRRGMPQRGGGVLRGQPWDTRRY